MEDQSVTYPLQKNSLIIGNNDFALIAETCSFLSV